MNATERRAAIDENIANGICHLCKQPVVDGDPVYTVQMTHWDCYEKLKIDVDKFLGGETQPFIGIPNGGWITHLVIGDKALCGHQPKNTARQMKARGRWYHVDNTRELTCTGCVKKHGKKTL